MAAVLTTDQYSTTTDCGSVDSKVTSRMNRSNSSTRSGASRDQRPPQHQEQGHVIIDIAEDGVSGVMTHEDEVGQTSSSKKTQVIASAMAGMMEQIARMQAQMQHSFLLEQMKRQAIID